MLNGRTVGLIADAAREFISIPDAAIKPPPGGMLDVSGNYLRGIATMDNRIILIVDVSKLVEGNV